MSEIRCELKNHNQIIFHNFPVENQRKFMKTKIFLNSNHNLKYYFEDADLCITYLFDDKVVTSKEINKMISFVESLFSIQVKMDENTKNSVEQSISLSSNFATSYEKLKSIKGMDFFATEDFNN